MRKVSSHRECESFLRGRGLETQLCLFQEQDLRSFANIFFKEKEAYMRILRNKTLGAGWYLRWLAQGISGRSGILIFVHFQLYYCSNICALYISQQCQIQFLTICMNRHYIHKMQAVEILEKFLTDSLYYRCTRLTVWRCPR